MSKPIMDYLVPWIRPLKFQVSAHIDLAWKDPSLHRMMPNENPLQPSAKVLEAIEKFSKMANRYPDQGTVIRRRIAEMNGLEGEENVVLGNGSSEIYDNVFRSFLEPGDEIIQQTPCFGIYQQRCQCLGGKVVSVPMIYRDKKLLYNPEGVLQAITPKTKIIVVANPNNPTGNFMDEADVLRLADTGLPFVIDEAYVEYSVPSMTKVGLLKKYNNVFITRTLSKAYGLAGMRFGYLLAEKEIAMKIAAMLLPWNVGTIPMRAALAALEDTEGLQKRIRSNNEQIAYIEEMMSKVPGLVVFPSQANYIFFDAGPTGKNTATIIEFVEKRGIIIRPESAKYGSDGWFRITIGSEEENKLLVKVLHELFLGKE